jgi:hypothetical protein
VALLLGWDKYSRHQRDFHVSEIRGFHAITALAALLCIALTAIGLVRAANWLTVPVPGVPGLPLGNLASWLSLVSLAWLALGMAGEGRLRGVAMGLLVLACGWLPVAALVAGNWALSFQGGNGWYVLLGATALLVLSAVLILAAGATTRWLRRRSSAR